MDRAIHKIEHRCNEEQTREYIADGRTGKRSIFTSMAAVQAVQAAQQRILAAGAAEVFVLALERPFCSAGSSPLSELPLTHTALKALAAAYQVTPAPAGWPSLSPDRVAAAVVRAGSHWKLEHERARARRERRKRAHAEGGKDCGRCDGDAAKRGSAATKAAAGGAAAGSASSGGGCHHDHQDSDDDEGSDDSDGSDGSDNEGDEGDQGGEGGDGSDAEGGRGPSAIEFRHAALSTVAALARGRDAEPLARALVEADVSLLINNTLMNNTWRFVHFPHLAVEGLAALQHISAHDSCRRPVLERDCWPSLPVIGVHVIEELEKFSRHLAADPCGDDHERAPPAEENACKRHEEAREKAREGEELEPEGLQADDAAHSQHGPGAGGGGSGTGSGAVAALGDAINPTGSGAAAAAAAVAAATATAASATTAIAGPAAVSGGSSARSGAHVAGSASTANAKAGGGAASGADSDSDSEGEIRFKGGCKLWHGYDADVARACAAFCAVIRNLAAVPELRRQLMSDNIAETVARMMRARRRAPEAAFAASGAVLGLACDAANCAPLQAMGAASAAVKLLRRHQADGRIAWAVCGILQKLAAVDKLLEPVQVVGTAAAALRRLASVPKNHPSLLSQGAVEVLAAAAAFHAPGSKAAAECRAALAALPALPAAAAAARV